MRQSHIPFEYWPTSARLEILIFKQGVFLAQNAQNPRQLSQCRLTPVSYQLTRTRQSLDHNSVSVHRAAINPGLGLGRQPGQADGAAVDRAVPAGRERERERERGGNCYNQTVMC